MLLCCTFYLHCFRLLDQSYTITDFFGLDMIRKLEDFGIQEGDVVVDYGCGPGRYMKKASELVGEEGLVYAADIHNLAIEKVQNLISKHQLTNVEPVLVHGYDSGLDEVVLKLYLPWTCSIT